jgi:UDP-N-acetyl-D-glucosamine dehydrogenase
VLVLGVTYKRDVNDVRESPALEVIRLLRDKGAMVAYADPLVPEMVAGDTKMVGVPVTAETLRSADCAVVVTDHRAFDYDLIAREAPVVVDVRNALRGVQEHRERIVRL